MKRKVPILVVEDEEAIRTGLIDVFVFHGYEAEGVATGPEGLERALSGKFVLILLDVMLPGMNGFEVCEQIRKVDRDQPIIMLTAKTSDDDIITGLRLGADDYVAKPFSVTQLVLRVGAVLRRAHVTTEAPCRFSLAGDIEIDTRNLSARRAAESLSFTRREMEILQYLYANAERPVSREELLSKV